MSLHYLLDGYNIIKQVPFLASKSLREGRGALMRLVEQTHPQGSLNNTVTVVFDGKEDVIGGEYHQAMKVIFTRGEKADDKIKQIVDEAVNKKRIVVVTDDRDIMFYVRRQGVKVVGVQEFLGKMKETPSGPWPAIKKTSKKDDAKYISKTLEHKITSEFEEIWLGKIKRKDG